MKAVFLIIIVSFLSTATARDEKVYLRYIDSGLDETARRYDIYAEVIIKDPESIEKAVVYIDNLPAVSVALVYKDHKLFIKDKVMFKLGIHNTKIRMKIKGNGFRDIDLVCTRAGRCL